MKKLIAVLATAALMTLGLVGFSGTPAQSADCPYTGCIDTNTNIRGPLSVARHQRATFKISVLVHGNARPRGSIRFTIARNKGGFSHTRVVPYRGKRTRITTPRLHRKGGYTVVARYRPAANAPFEGSGDRVALRVRKRG